MRELTKREEMTVQFATALKDCFRDEDDRESDVFSPIDLNSNADDANGIILAMFNAVRIIFLELTSHDCDSIDFMAIITHLLLQEVKNGGMDIKDKETIIGDDEGSYDE